MSDFVSSSIKLLTIVKENKVEVSDDINSLVNNITKCIEKAQVCLADTVSNWVQDGIKQNNEDYRQFRKDGDKYFQNKKYLNALDSYR